MHQVYVDIIVDAIIEQYQTEENFDSAYQIQAADWQAWKEGQFGLDNEVMQKIKNLFTDYEWMLTQKILRQTILFPEKRNLAVSEYKRLKTTIAKKWLQSDLGVVELIPNNKQEQEIAAGYIDLKVTLAYGEWGFDDIITFRLPATIQRQLEGSKVELLDWVNENLMDTYVGE